MSVVVQTCEKCIVQSWGREGKGEGREREGGCNSIVVSSSDDDDDDDDRKNGKKLNIF